MVRHNVVIFTLHALAERGNAHWPTTWYCRFFWQLILSIPAASHVEIARRGPSLMAQSVTT